jgi:peptide/nickel transport system substrate-binding protein
MLLSIAFVLVFTSAALTQTQTPRRGGVLKIGLPVDPINLDPAMMSHMEAHRFVAQVYPTLLRYNEKLELVPDIAQSHRVIDNVTYEFKIRPGVMFHHGRELVAQDVKYSIERVLDPKITAPERFEVEPVKEVQVVDKYTVRIVTKEPFAPILHGLTFGLGIVPREKVEEWGDLRTQASGTGAFRLISYVPNRHVILERFGRYYGGPPHLERVEYIYMPDDTARATALRAGDIHMARFDDPKVVATLRPDRNLTVLKTGSPRILHFHLNNKRKPFDDVRVRQAMSYALDRDAISRTVFLGDASPSGPIPPTMTQWALPTREFPSYTRNLARARQLLAEAGHPRGFRSTIMASTVSPTDIMIAQVIKEQLAEVGIELEIRQREWGELLDLWITQRNFDTFLISSFTGRDPDANFYRRFHSKSTRNTVGYVNPRVDELMDRSRTTIDAAQRKRIFDDLQKLIVEEAPKIFVTDYPYYEVHRREVNNWVIHPMGIHYHLGQVWLSR